VLLKRSASSGNAFRLYDGFEPSGRMHIAQGLLKAMNVNKATSAGGHFIFWVADLFALMNDKMGGDLSKIQTVGEYLIEVWKAAGMLGLNESVHFLWCADELREKAHIYWPLMLDVGRRFNITRIKKCCQIMGRLEGNLTAAQVLYPLMQCTDIFFLKADICQLGLDQRKVNMLAREYADCDKKKIKKPVILSHHMLLGLKKGQEKMSKSDPDSAVFMEDTREDVERKIMSAYCPRTTESDGLLKNPCLDYIENIIFAPPDATFSTSGKEHTNFESVKTAFLSDNILEEELKKSLIHALNELLEPVRMHFHNDDNAKQLLEKVQKYKRESTSQKIQHQIRKLDLVELGAVQQGSHIVFLPMPSARPTLQMAMDVLKYVDAVDESVPVVLYFRDWTAKVCNALDADSKAIDAYYKLFLSVLNCLGLKEKGITFIRQSEAILKDPSNYWISVINIGRFFSLNDVMGPGMKDSDGVGKVIGRLMKVADVLALAPSSVAFPTDPDAEVEMSLIEKYLCSISETNCVSMKISTPSILLMQRESAAHKTDLDEYYVMDDPKVHGKSKMKKSFCEPGNISFNPPISLASVFSAGSSFQVARSPDNGGDVSYSSREEIESDFKSGALHPGDLKNAVSKLMVSVLTKLAQTLKNDTDANKACKALKAFDKKMKKKQTK